MSINADRSIVLIGVRTPDRFIFVHVKILIPSEEVNHFYFDFSLSMGESTELFVIAFGILIGISLAKFGFITTGVVNLLYFIMRVTAVLIFASSLWA